MNISSISSQITSNIFSKIDTKNQGYIDKSDLTTALSQLNGNSSSDSSTDDLFSQIDTDGDGKITKSELSVGVENLLTQLQSAQAQGMKEGASPPPEGMEGMPPPPPPKSGDSEGVTQDQAEKIASTSTDSKLSGLMKTISENFEAADTNHDGKVSRDEAMSYMKQSDTDSSSSTGTASQAATSQDSLVQNMIQQLVKAYGFGTDSSSSIAVSA